jgi:hypothetical protein
LVFPLFSSACPVSRGVTARGWCSIGGKRESEAARLPEASRRLAVGAATEL